MHPHLIKLLALNKGKGFFKAETAADEATLYLYDVIVSDDYWGGVSALSFAKQLAAITAPVIHLRINSPGGDVFAARAMVQAMKDHSSQIIAHVDGMAASAATFLVMSADQSMISEGAGFMIHNAWTIAFGNANDLQQAADLLRRVDNTIANDYAAKTGKSVEDIAALMDAETYYFGQEAVDNGFVDQMAETAPKNAIKWDMSAYKNAPISDQNTEIPEENSEENQEQQSNETLIIQQNRNRLRLNQALLTH